MKKIVLLLGLMLATGTCAFADCDYECVAPYNLNSKFRAVMSTATGVNSIVENKVESILKKEVLNIGSADKLKIDLDSYSPKDLKSGIFKSMKVEAQNVVVNNIYLDSLKLRTLCDFNYIKQVNKEVVFVEALPMSFDISMSQASINKTMEHAKYQKVINDLNKIISSRGFGLKISSTKVAIKSNKFYYIIGFEIPFVRNEQKIVLISDLNVKNGKISFTDTKLASGNINVDLRRIDFIMNYLNPLDFSINIIQDKDAKVTVKNVDIKNNMIIADGLIVVPKD